MRGRSFIASLALIGAGLMLATTARAQDPTVLPMPRPGGWAVTADNVTLIVSVTDKAELAYVDTTTMKEVKRVSLDFKPTSLALRGKTLFAATKGSALVHILDAASGKENKEIKVPGDGVRQLECHPTKGHVFAATMSNEIFAIEPESGEVTKTPARGQFLAIDPKDGSALYTGTQQPFRDQMEVRGGPGGKLIITFDRTGKRATLLKYSVKGKELKLVAGNNDTAINGKAVRVTPDGAKVAMIGGGGWESKTDRKRKYIVPLYTSKDLKDMVGEVEIGAYPIDLAFHPVLKICAGCKTGQALILFNSKSLAELKTISPIRKDSLLMDPVLLTFAGRGTKMVYWCPAGVQKQGQGALLFYDLTLNDEQKADLAKAYGKK